MGKAPAPPTAAPAARPRGLFITRHTGPRLPRLLLETTGTTSTEYPQLPRANPPFKARRQRLPPYRHIHATTTPPPFAAPPSPPRPCEKTSQHTEFDSWTAEFNVHPPKKESHESTKDSEYSTFNSQPTEFNVHPTKKDSWTSTKDSRRSTFNSQPCELDSPPPKSNSPPCPRHPRPAAVFIRPAHLSPISVCRRTSAPVSTACTLSNPGLALTS